MSFLYNMYSFSELTRYLSDTPEQDRAFEHHGGLHLDNPSARRQLFLDKG